MNTVKGPGGSRSGAEKAETVRYEVIRRTPKGNGLEVVVRIMRVAGQSLVDIRDYYPESDEYGRGFYLPSDLVLASQINEGIGEAIRRLSNEAS